jgi:hypothetical protein
MHSRGRPHDGHSPATAPGYSGPPPDYHMVAPLNPGWGDESAARGRANFGAQQQQQHMHAIPHHGHRAVHGVSPVPWPQAHGQMQASPYDYGGAYSPYNQPLTPTMGYSYGANSGIYGAGYSTRCVPSMHVQSMQSEHGGAGFLAPVTQRTSPRAYEAQVSQRPQPIFREREQAYSP